VTAPGTYQQLATEVAFEALDLVCEDALLKAKSVFCSPDGGMGSNDGETVEALPAAFFLERGPKDRGRYHGFPHDVEVPLVAGSSASPDGDAEGVGPAFHGGCAHAGFAAEVAEVAAAGDVLLIQPGAVDDRARAPPFPEADAIFAGRRETVWELTPTRRPISCKLSR